MKDFASAAMMRLVQAGLASQDLDVGDVPMSAGAHVPLAEKRQVLKHVFDRFGPLPILRIAAAVSSLPPEPMHTALAISKSPDDLIERWQRLERYVHSRHRIKAECSASGDYHLVHSSLTDEAPRPEESLLVFGLLIVLFDMLPDWTLKQASICDNALVFTQGAWTEMSPVRRAGRVRIVLERNAPVEMDRGFVHNPHSDTVLSVRALLEDDPGRRWSVKTVAEALAMTPRSLQRKLSDRQTSFSQLIREVRTARAAEMLACSTHSAAEIGFVCGFADQAHFIRSFKSGNAMTPAVYRREFASSTVSRS